MPCVLARHGINWRRYAGRPNTVEAVRVRVEQFTAVEPPSKESAPSAGKTPPLSTPALPPPPPLPALPAPPKPPALQPTGELEKQLQESLERLQKSIAPPIVGNAEESSLPDLPKLPAKDGAKGEPKNDTPKVDDTSLPVPPT